MFLVRKSFFAAITLTLVCHGVGNYLSFSKEQQQNLPKLAAQTISEAEIEAEIVAEMEQLPGNITVTPDGRIILSLHQFYQTPERVVELKTDGSIIPFPNSEWNQGRKEDGTGLDSVLGIQADPNGIVWMLDNGMRGDVTPQLVGWNTSTDTLEIIIPLEEPIVEPNSFLNDLAVDLTNQAIYIADPTTGGTPALIVINLRTQETRRVLAGDQSVAPEDIDLVIEGNPVQMRQSDGTLIKPRVGVNPIALDINNEWLYFGPMHGTRLYRLRTQDLLNFELNETELAQKVEDYAQRPISDGISIDSANNIYITDVSANAIGVIKSDRTYQRLFSEPWVSWPNAFSFGPDGYLYSVINQLHKTPALNAGVDEINPPFPVIRFQPLADGLVGR